MHIWTIIASCFSVLFSALVGLLVWRLQRMIENREKARVKHEAFVVEGIGAAIALGEATAVALRDGHANGNTEDALKYARDVKRAQKTFLIEQGIQALH